MSPQPLPLETEIDPKESPYIRTYAKDYARLSGKETPAPKTPKKRHRKNDDSLITKAEDAVVTPELSELEHEAEVRDAQTTEQQKEISAQLAEIDGPAPVAAAAAAASAIPAEATTKKRESLLERLHARAGATSAAPLSSSVLQPILPEKIETDLPATTRSEDRVAPPTPKPVPIPVAPAAPVPSIRAQEPPAPFHSFSTDFADRVDTQRASTFSVLAAEKDNRPAAPRPKHHSNVLPILAGIALLLLGSAGIFAAYHYMQGRAPVSIVPTVTTLIAPDKELVLSGNDLTAAFLKAASQSLPQGDVLITYITTATSSPNGESTQIPNSSISLFETLFPSAPDILLRNIGPVATIGVIHAGAETRPFFLLQSSSYERTFAGMLGWENTMAQDFSSFYPPYPAQVAATTTATTTSPAPVTSSFQAPLQFTDELVASHSVRVLRDAEGRSLMLYGYTADKQVLIIARDETAFTELLNRLSASGN